MYSDLRIAYRKAALRMAPPPPEYPLETIMLVAAILCVAVRKEGGDAGGSGDLQDLD